MISEKLSGINIVVDQNVVVISGPDESIRYDVGVVLPDIEVVPLLRDLKLDETTANNFHPPIERDPICQDDFWVKAGALGLAEEDIQELWYEIDEFYDNNSRNPTVLELKTMLKELESIEAEEDVIDKLCESDLMPWPSSVLKLIDAARKWSIHYTARTPIAVEGPGGVAELALKCQDASNLPGLLRSWASWSLIIIDDASAKGIPVNSHPVHRAMAEKLRQLAGGDDGAYSELLELSKKKR